MKKKIVSTILSAAVVCSAVGELNVAHAADTDEWTEICSIISKYQGRWDSPPSKVVTQNMTSGAILGNGDLAVVQGGDENSQTYYIAKSDFWSEAKSDGSDGKPKAIGGINIKNADSGQGSVKYSLTQNILDAELTSDITFSGNPIHTRSWVAPDDNILITEISSIENEDINVSAEIWAAAAESYPTAAGADENTVWITKSTPRRSQWSVYAATAMTAIGADNVTAVTKDDNTAVLSFTVPAGETAYLVSATDGGKENTNALENALAMLSEADNSKIEQLDDERAAWWKDYWMKEYVVLNDELLEEYYYGSLYQMGAASREGKVAPGLFGHWTTTEDPAWGGDYTLDYNYYGPFNGMASSNRLEQMSNMYQPILDFMEEGRKRAQNIKSVNGVSFPDGLPGVQYPTHIGPWGMETYFDCGMKSHAVFASIPFTWYYNYTQDMDFLENTAYPYMKAVADFWDAYLQKDSSGRYVVYESSARESWSGSNDTNPCIDLAFIRNLYTNIIPMSEALGVDEDRRDKWRDILENLSPAPTTEYNGITVFRESENRPEISTYGLGDNPVNMQNIFPGDNIGLDSDPELLEIARNSLRIMNSWNQGNAFANIFVMGARVGWPADDLMNKMKKRIKSVRQPNLTYQSDGHGLEGTGVLEAINSMLMQSHEGVLRMFPVWPEWHDAKFKRMRAVGAFLVDGEIKGNVVQPISITSEAGKPCVIENPWEGRELQVMENGTAVDVVKEGNRYTFNTEAGKTYEVSPVGGVPEPEPTPEVPGDTEIMPVAPSPLPEPDLGWWKADDNGELLTDSSAYENDADIIGAQYTDGRLNGALSFNGYDNYAFVKNYEKPANVFTYSAWVKAKSHNTWATIVKNWGENTKGQIQLGLESSTGKLNVYVTQANNNEVSCTDPNPFPLDVWQHVAAVADGSRIRLYRNGIEVASTSYNGSLKTSFAPLGIGVKPNDSGTGAATAATSPGYWNGEIDDVRIYSVPLAADEVATLAQFERFSSLYKEDFEDGDSLNAILENRNGWTIAGPTNEMVIQRGDNLGLSSNTIRFGSGSDFGNDRTLSLNIKESWIEKQVADGVERSDAEREAEAYLSGDTRLSFQAYLKCDDSYDEGAYYYIKLRDSEQKPFAVLRAEYQKQSTGKQSSLDLIALDGSKTQNIMYNIASGSSNIFEKMINVCVDFRKEDNTYKLTVNGNPVQTENGEWIPVSDNDGTGEASPAVFGEYPLEQIDFEVRQAGWWQVITIDNIELSVSDSVAKFDAQITDVTSSGNNEYLVTGRYMNNLDKEMQADIIYALYDENNALIGVVKDSIEADACSGGSFEKNIVSEVVPKEVRVFIWNSVSEMTPLSYRITQEYKD